MAVRGVVGLVLALVLRSPAAALEAPGRSAGALPRARAAENVTSASPVALDRGPRSERYARFASAHARVDASRGRAPDDPRPAFTGRSRGRRARALPRRSRRVGRHARARSPQPRRVRHRVRGRRAPAARARRDALAGASPPVFRGHGAAAGRDRGPTVLAPDRRSAHARRARARTPVRRRARARAAGRRRGTRRRGRRGRRGRERHDARRRVLSTTAPRGAARRSRGAPASSDASRRRRRAAGSLVRPPVAAVASPVPHRSIAVPQEES